MLLLPKATSRPVFHGDCHLLNDFYHVFQALKAKERERPRRRCIRRIEWILLWISSAQKRNRKRMKKISFVLWWSRASISVLWGPPLLPLLHLRFRFRFVPPLLPPLLPPSTPLYSQFECIGVILLEWLLVRFPDFGCIWRQKLDSMWRGFEGFSECLNNKGWTVLPSSVLIFIEKKITCQKKEKVDP